MVSVVIVGRGYLCPLVVLLLPNHNGIDIAAVTTAFLITITVTERQAVGA